MSSMIEDIAKLFGASEKPELLPGGQGTTYKCGSFILKPVDSLEEANWLAEQFFVINSTDNVRIPKPIKSTHGNWVEEDFVAWSFLEGNQKDGRYAEKIHACDAYNGLVSHMPKPSFMVKREDAWAIADKRVWGDLPIDYNAEWLSLVEDILYKKKDLNLPSQVIHGDFNGNVLFAEGVPPAVVDLSPYWRPADFAKAIIFIDAVVLDKNINLPELKTIFESIDEIYQLTLYATLRRVFEQFEHIRVRKMEPEGRLAEARLYIDGFKRSFG